MFFDSQCRPITFTIVVGAVCETNIDDCAINPCQNNGTCYDLVNGYRCSCMPEYVGSTCSQAYCGANNPCRNGATCHGAGRCLCPPGFVLADCSVDRCDLLDCQNGGSCVNGSCVCPPGVIGANCDVVQCSVTACMVRYNNRTYFLLLADLFISCTNLFYGLSVVLLLTGIFSFNSASMCIELYV